MGAWVKPTDRTMLGYLYWLLTSSASDAWRFRRVWGIDR